MLRHRGWREWLFSSEAKRRERVRSGGGASERSVHARQSTANDTPDEKISEEMAERCRVERGRRSDDEGGVCFGREEEETDGAEREERERVGG